MYFLPMHFDKRCLEVSGVEEDVGVAIELLVDHEGEDAHHGGAALVELLGAELVLLLLGGVTDESDGEASAGAEVTGEGSRVLAPDGELEEADEEEDLGDAGEGDLVQGGEARGDVLEADALLDGEVAAETEAGGGPEVAEEGELGDAAVLELDVTEAVEALLVGVLQEAEGIVEAEGLLDTDCLCLRRNMGERVWNIRYQVCNTQHMFQPSMCIPRIALLSCFCTMQPSSEHVR